MLEQLYKRLSHHASAARSRQGLPKVTRETLGESLAFMFAHVVELEDAIAEDDERKIAAALATVAIDALVALHDLEEPWCLRSPRHKPGRYQDAAELTGELRHRVQAVLQYWQRGDLRDTGVTLELVLKSAHELASRLDFDLSMAIGTRLNR